MNGPQQIRARTKPARVSDEGLTELYHGRNGDKPPVADLVFVHGLQGHPRKTWTHAGPSPVVDHQPSITSRIIRRLICRPRSASPDIDPGERDVFWPQDLLPHDFPNCRILTFGYDSHITKFFGGAANQGSIMDHGNDLLRRLTAQRINDTKRKVIFMAHSLGGLVLKEALRRCRTDLPELQDHRDILSSTTAILFFGTPHRGGEHVELGLIAQKIALAVGFSANDKNLKDLRRNATLPRLLSEDFASIVRLKEIAIETFLEGQGYHSHGILRGKIVEDDAAMLYNGREHFETINKNHIEMCRFVDRDDSGYTKVTEALSRHVGNIIRALQEEAQRAEELRRAEDWRRAEEAQEAGHAREREEAEQLQRREIRAQQEREKVNVAEDQIHACVESLQAAPMKVRPRQVAEPWSNQSAYTLGWLWSKTLPPNGPGLVQWLREGHGIFWIRGKAGSGKSTAMKSIWKSKEIQEHLAASCDGKNSSQWLVICAFFHDRGMSIQRSLAGVLKRLLYKIFKKYPALREIVLSKMVKPKDPSTSGAGSAPPRVEEAGSNPELSGKYIPTKGSEYQWGLLHLKKAFLAVVAQQVVPMKVCAMVDALDEHEEGYRYEEQHSAMVTFFQDLLESSSSSVQLRMIVSSRPEAVFISTLGDNPGFTMERFTRSDIVKYIDGTLGARLKDIHPSSRNPRNRINGLLPQSGSSSARSSRNNLRLPGSDDVDKFTSEIAEKAEGVFLWVHLVVQELLKLCKGSPFLQDLRRKLDEFPSGLKDLYHYILKRIDPGNYLQSYIMLELVLRSQNSLRLIELCAMTIILSYREDMRTFENNDSGGGLLDEMLSPILETIGHLGARQTSQHKVQCRLALSQKLKCMLNDRCMGLLEIVDPTEDSRRRFHNASSISGTSFSPESSLHNAETSDDEASTSLPHTPTTSNSAYGEDFDRPEDYNCQVQFLHQTAKEFLSGTRTLQDVFKDKIDAAPNPRFSESGDLLLLQYCQRWLQLSPRMRSKLKSVMMFCRPEIDLLRYAPMLEPDEAQYESSESLLKRSITSSTRLLLDLDTRISARSSLGSSWPEKACEVLGLVDFPGPLKYGMPNEKNEPSTWRSNFLSFGVCREMRYFVAETLNEYPGLVNGKPGRPLLNYAVYGNYRCNLQMVKDLIAQKADIHAVIKEELNTKTALQSLDWATCQEYEEKGVVAIDAVEVLLHAGANPNSVINDHDPLDFAVFKLKCDELARLRVLKLLYSLTSRVSDSVIESVCSVNMGNTNEYIRKWLLDDLKVVDTAPKSRLRHPMVEMVEQAPTVPLDQESEFSA